MKTREIFKRVELSRYPLPYMIVAGHNEMPPTRGFDQPEPEITFSYTPPFREAQHEG
jgi:hypothetical protein